MCSRKIEEITIETLEDFIKELDKKRPTFDENVLYRGQEENLPLMPALFRKSLIGRPFKDIEETLMSSFKRHALPLLKIIPRNDIQWLALAQHYGLSTRLLDWGDNPLVALFFAVNNLDVDTELSVIWEWKPHRSLVMSEDMISAFRLGDTSSNDDEIHVNPRQNYLLGLYYPRHISSRISAQQGCFAVFEFPTYSGSSSEQEFTPFEDWYSNNVRTENDQTIPLRKYIIPGNRRKLLKQQLDVVGVNAFTIFPDLGGLCEKLEWDLYVRDDPYLKRT